MMKLNNQTIAKIALTLVCFCASGAHATIIDQNGPSAGSNGSFPGVSLTTGTGGPWNNITFSFFDTNNVAEASGDLFILTSEYLGTPTALSSGSSGFLAQSTSAIGGAWQFASSIILNASTTYFFLVDEQFSHTTANGSGGNISAGSAAYFASSATSIYYTINSDAANWDYLLQGTATSSVPAPATLALFALGLAGLGWSKRKKA